MTLSFYSGKLYLTRSKGKENKTPKEEYKIHEKRAKGEPKKYWGEKITYDPFIRSLFLCMICPLLFWTQVV